MNHHGYHNFHSIRHVFFPQIWPLRLIIRSISSVNKIWHACFSEDNIANPCQSAWNRTCTSWQLITSIDRQNNCKNGIWNEQICLFILSYGRIYSVWRSLKPKIKCMLTYQYSGQMLENGSNFFYFNIFLFFLMVEENWVGKILPVTMSEILLALVMSGKW